MSRPRLLFIVKQKQGESLWEDKTDRKPGISNSIESVVTGLIKNGVDAHIRYALDRNVINRFINDVKPSVVILECYWVTPGKIALLKTLHPSIHWIIRNHSEVPFLAQEGMAGAWNCEYLKMGVEVSSVSMRTVEDLSPIIFNLDLDPGLLTHLPNIYLNSESESAFIKDLPKDEIHIGCFGALRNLKNHVEQAMASIGYAAATGKKLYFHINGNRIEGNGSQPLKHLRGLFDRLNNCELVEHPWMDKTQFYTLLRDRIDVVLQCSLTESFNIVSADAVYCCVPVIASSEVQWLSSRSHVDPCSSVSITAKIAHVFNNTKTHLAHYVCDQIVDLADYNERSIAVWTKRFT